MNTYETILKRRSIRKYKDQSISDEQIDIILKAAIRSDVAKLYVSDVQSHKVTIKIYRHNTFENIATCEDLREWMFLVANKLW